MKLTAKILLYPALFHLVLGLALLVTGYLVSPTVAFYECLATSLFAPNYDALHSKGINEKSQLILQPLKFANDGQSAPLPIISLHKSSTLASFAHHPPSPMDYAVLLYQLHLHGAKHIYISAPFSWSPEPDNIVKSAFTYEFSRFHSHLLALPMSESIRQEELPPSLKQWCIPAENVKADFSLFPRADKLVSSASELSFPELNITASIVENNPLFHPKHTFRTLPLLVRWGDKLLPTLPLIAALNALELSPQAVHLTADNKLILGDKRVIPLDTLARAETPANTAPTILATDDVIVNNIPGLPQQANPIIRKLCQESDAVFISEPFTSADSVDAGLIHQAMSTRTIMAGLSPLPPIEISAAPFWAEIIILIDVLLIGLWALRFGTWGRLLTWGGSAVGVLVLAYFLLETHQLWFQLQTPLFAIIFIALFGTFLPWFKFSASDNQDSSSDDDSTTSPRLASEEIYQEPNEIPIPHSNSPHS